MPKSKKGPYRLRTLIRIFLPYFLIDLGLASKGEDCEKAKGHHEWYNIDDEHIGCYHCEVTREHKPYGINTGNLTSEGAEELLTCSEIHLYSCINAIGGFIWSMNHDMSHGRIKSTLGIEKDLAEAQYSIEYTVLQSRRFGVDIPDVKVGEHVERTKSYNNWFSWWNTYVMGLSDEKWKELEAKMEKRENVSEFRPEGDWRTI